MNFKKNIALAALLGAAACGAQAQMMGKGWYGGLGVTHIAPNVDSGSLSAPSAPGTMVDIGGDTQVTAFVGKMLDDHWSVEVPLGLGFKHEITGAGAIAGVGKIGTVRALPVSVFGQYRFLEPASKVRPYVMLGLTYAYFYHERGSAALNGVNPANPPGGTGLSVDSRFGVSPGLGVSVAINDKWFVDAKYIHTFLKTTTTLSSGQTIDTKLNPDSFFVGVGMRF